MHTFTLNFGPILADLFYYIRAIMHRANSFLDTHDVNSTAAAAGADGEAGQDVSGDAEGGGDVEALKRELQELRSISQASQVIASCFAVCCLASRCCAVQLGFFI